MPSIAAPCDLSARWLEIGADPNPADHAGFPLLIAALSCSLPRLGASGRPDVSGIIGLLLSFAADPNQRGINDYTPVQMAVSDAICRQLRFY